MKLPKDYLNNKDFLRFKKKYQKEEIKSFKEYQKRHKVKLTPIYSDDSSIWECWIEELKKK